MISDGTACGCPEGTFDSKSSCQSCSSDIPHCDRCSNASTCLHCSSNFILNSAGTACQCPEGTSDAGSSCETKVSESGFPVSAIIAMSAGSVFVVVGVGYAGLVYIKKRIITKVARTKIVPQKVRITSVPTLNTEVNIIDP